MRIVGLEHEVNVLKQSNEQLSQQLSETIESKDGQIAELSTERDTLNSQINDQVRSQHLRPPLRRKNVQC